MKEDHRTQSDCSAALVNGSIDGACDWLAKKGSFVEFGCVVAEKMQCGQKLARSTVANSHFVRT